MKEPEKDRGAKAWGERGKRLGNNLVIVPVGGRIRGPGVLHLM